MSVPGTPAWLRTHNDRGAFRLFLEHGPLSRSQLGELSGLSKPTAGQMIARLEKLGLITPAGESSGSRGPSAVAYGAREDSLTGVAVSVLADAIEAVVVGPTDRDHPVAQLPVASLGERSPAHDVQAGVRAACEAAGFPVGSVSAVTVGVQAAVDSAADELRFTDTLPGWPHSGPRRQIEQALGVHVMLENDVNLATVAERATGAIGDLRSFSLLWLGDGLGLGTDVDGVVQRGAFGGAGEIGYLEPPRSALAIDPDARDFTDLLGGPAILRLAGRAEPYGFRDAVAELDDAAFEQIAERVALLARPVLAVAEPGAIVLGGPTGNAGGERLARLVAERIAVPPVPGASAAQVLASHRVAVRTSAAGGHPVLQGARRLLVDAIRLRLEESITVDLEPVP